MNAEAVSSSATSTESVASSLRSVQERVTEVASSIRSEPVRLVAVSKTKPVQLLQAAYDAGQRYFGENYVQELVEKAEQMPSDINWHFIGPLQSNKAKVLLSVPNLHVVESVDREKIASALNRAVETNNRSESLKVMVQVNTSGEDTKSGCNPGETLALADFVENKCEKLELVGLMTIGAPDESEEPEAFRILSQERDAVAEGLSRDKESLKLSMGMSSDYEAAIRMGSDSVRVGSTIFGARDYSKK